MSRKFKPDICKRCGYVCDWQPRRAEPGYQRVSSLCGECLPTDGTMIIDTKHNQEYLASRERKLARYKTAFA